MPRRPGGWQNWSNYWDVSIDWVESGRSENVLDRGKGRAKLKETAQSIRGQSFSGVPTGQRILAFVLPCLILCLGLALRLHDLAGKSLWFDELGTLNYVAWDTTWLDTLRWPLTLPSIPIPPLYFAITRLFTGLGYGEFILRWPSLLFSTLTLALTYALGKLWFDRWVAAVATFFLAIAPLHIRYAQEARSYATMVFFAILSLYLFWRALQSKRRRWWLAFVFVTILSLYTHLFSLLPLGVMGLFGIMLWLRDRAQSRLRFQMRYFVAAMGASLLAFLPMWPHILAGLSSDRGLGENLELVVGGLRWGTAGLISFLRLFGAETDVGAILYALLFLLGALFLARKQRQVLGLALLWIVLPVLLVFALPFGHRVLIRYFLFALPVYLLAGAYGLVEAGRWLGHKLAYRQSWAGARWTIAILTGVLAVGLFAVVGMPAVAAYYREGKQDWRDATRLLLAYAQPGDQIYVPDERDQTGIISYARQLASVPTGMDRLSVRVLPGESLDESLPDSKERGWLVVPFQVQYLPGGVLDTALKAHRLFPPLVVSVDHVPKDWKSIAPYSYGSLALVYFEPSAPEGKTCQPGGRKKFQAWLLAGEELAGARVNTDFSLGLLAYYCGDMEEALQRLSPRALSPSQDVFITWLLGDASQELGRWDEAIDYYRQAMNINPNYAWLEVKIGNIYRDLGEFEKAQVSYLRALEANGDQDWPHAELANLYEQMGRPELALQEYRRASELSSRNARYMIKMGQIYVQLSDFREAKSSYQRAMDLEPDNAWYYTLLASVNVSLGEPIQAVKEYEKALALNPAYAENAWFQLQLANAYRLAGRRDEAIGAYEQVLALDEDNAAAEKGLKELGP